MMNATRPRPELTRAIAAYVNAQRGQRTLRSELVRVGDIGRSGDYEPQGPPEFDPQRNGCHGSERVERDCGPGLIESVLVTFAGALLLGLLFWAAVVGGVLLLVLGRK